MKKISIILPVYNEETVIEAFTQVLLATLEKIKNYQFEIVYVVDKSRDKSWDVIKKLGAKDIRIRGLLLSKRYGHQHSLVAGMDSCLSDAVIMMDSDLQHPPEVIPELLKKFEEGFDVVHTKRQYHESTGFHKKMTSSLFYKMIQKLSDVHIEEDAADFRLISQKVLLVFQGKIREQNQFLRGLFHWVGFKQCYVHFYGQERHSGQTKYSIKRLIRFAVTGIVSFSRVPLKFSIYTGLVISSLSLLYVLYLILSFILGKEYPPGWTTLTVILFFFMGIQFIFMGIFGEYLGAIFDEVKKRPLYLIEESFASNSDEKY